MPLEAWFNISVQIGDAHLPGWVVVCICCVIFNAVAD